jgi:HlyD family secretion protein
MDKIIEKKAVPVSRWIAIGGAALVALPVVWQLMARTSSTRLSVDPDRITTAVVQEGEFLEYYPFDGTVQPATSVYLDVEEGGRVEQIVAEGGQHVEKGDLILRFSNATLQRTAIDTETQLLYNLDIQRNSQFERAQSTLILKDTLLDLEHQIVDAENKSRRYDELQKAGNMALSEEQFETQRNQLEYLKHKRDLLKERVRQEDLLSQQQVADTNKSISRINTSLELLGRIVKSLEVRAPISGFLSTIDAQVGQNVNPGQRIGQIDLLDKFKVRVKIDQYYISRVAIGTPGRVNVDGKVLDVKVQKVYPEVRDSAFEADVVFTGETPDTLKRGQTLTIELTFGTPTRTLIVAKGGFFQETSGRWVYLVAKDGSSAQRTMVRLGRQNPRDVEVLDGLKAGDRIVTSSYEGYNSVERLQFNSTLKSERGKT